MKKINIAGEISASEIGLGCMRIAGLSEKDAEKLVKTALEAGINFFDHADVYADGEAERAFSKAAGMSPAVREKLVIQTKCGIRDGYYDFSKEHILSAVDGSLRRLRTDYVDILLLHRPDTLMEPEEVAEAFNALHASGKVRLFGVSNFNPMQIELLSHYINQKLVVDQLQLSLTNTGMIDSGIDVNTKFDGAVERDGSILEYCRLRGITIQAWSPFQYGFFEGVFLGSDKYPELNKKIGELAAAKGVTESAIAIAWILRHPAKIQPIVGTTNAGRLRDIAKASDAELSREEWYGLYKAAGNIIP